MQSLSGLDLAGGVRVFLDLWGVLLDSDKMQREYGRGLARYLGARFGGDEGRWIDAHNAAWTAYVEEIESPDWDRARWAGTVDRLDATFAVSIPFKRRLGLYGKLFDSPIGMVGFTIVMFWVYTAIFANLVMTEDPLYQIVQLKNASIGSILPKGSHNYPYYLLGGDNLARDVFSRMVAGARLVLVIAPAATAVACWLVC